MKELLIGCGHSRDKRLHAGGKIEFDDLTTLDVAESVNPDVVYDLNDIPYPFLEEEFDEIHAYEVLEHCGTQGDWRFFFAQFSEFYRMLKDGGHMFITCPAWNNRWAWGDPGHTRVIGFEQLVFLDDRVNVSSLVSSMTDYSSVWKGSFHIVHIEPFENTVGWILKKVKI